MFNLDCLVLQLFYNTKSKIINNMCDERTYFVFSLQFFSKNRTANLLTITPRNESYLDIIGEVQTISYHDAKFVCQLYDCSSMI